MEAVDVDGAVATVAAAEPSVVAAWVFGSRARGEARLGSDLDVSILAPGATGGLGLHLGCEIVLDVGNHVLAGVLGRTPETYEQILDALAAENVLSAGLRGELTGLGGFRNVLVHDYLDVDPERVIAALARAPERFEAFAAELHRWLAARQS